MRINRYAAACAITLVVTVAIPVGRAHADSIRDRQWYLTSLHVSQAQAISKGAGVTVAVVDTGAYPHPDLRRNLLGGVDIVSGGAGNGQADEAGHGTNMAAIISAHGTPGNAGVLGIAPAAKVLPVKIGDSADGMRSANMATGVAWATKHGAKVINISAGAGPAFELQNAVTSAMSADIVVVASVGNRSKVGLVPYPAAMDGVLVVGAIGRDGRHAALSLESPRVQICAPGVGITTAEPQDKYVSTDGTSPATAIVSGATALVRARFPQLSAKDVINRLTATADDIGPPGRDDECGYGVLNIVKALTADIPRLESTAAPTTTATDMPPSETTPGAPHTDNAIPSATNDTGSSAATAIAVVVAALIMAGLVGYIALRRSRRS